MFGSAAGFGLSGPFVAPLLQAGWSPASAVAVRAFGAGLFLLVPALLSLRGRFASLWRSWKLILTYSIVAVVCTQFFYFASVVYLEVSTAVLIKCTAPVLVVGYLWIRTGIAPKALTIVGAVASLLGVVLVLEPSGDERLSVLGLVFAVLAAGAMAAYFFVSAHPNSSLPPLALLSFGLMAGGTITGLLGVLGVLPFAMTFGSVNVAGQSWPWFAPLLIVIVLATTIPYICGLLGTRAAQLRVASFIALTETIFSAIVAWIILDQALGLNQFFGGVLVLAGVLTVQLDRSQSRNRLAKEN